MSPLCVVCGERPAATRGRCHRCHGYWHRTGQERPRDYTPMTRQAAAQLGGRTVVRERGAAWMAAIGRAGGLAVSVNREWMRELARRRWLVPHRRGVSR